MQHGNAGAICQICQPLKEFIDTIRARDRGRLLPVMGIYAHDTGAVIFGHFGHPKRICKHDNAREAWVT